MEWLRKWLFPTNEEKSLRKIKKLEKEIRNDIIPLPLYIFRNNQDMQDYIFDFYGVELTDKECDLLFP